MDVAERVTRRSRASAIRHRPASATRLAAAAPGLATLSPYTTTAGPPPGGRPRPARCAATIGPWPTGHPDPRRRHRSGAGGGDLPRPRRDRDRLRVGAGRGRRGGDRAVRHTAPGPRPRVGQAQQGRAQGADHDPGRGGLPERQRGAPPGARPVRQPAARALDEGPRHPLRGRRPRHRPREHRGPVRRHRAHGRPRRRREHQDHHPCGVRADRPVRLRLRGRERPAQGHRRPQGEHHEAVRRALPRELPDRRRRLRGPDRVRGPHRRQHVHAARPEAGAVRRPRPAEPVRRHRQRPGGRAGRRARASRRAPTSGPRRRLRAGPRVGAQVRRPGQGEPDRDDPVGRADAPPPRLPGRGDAARDGRPRDHRRGHARRPTTSAAPPARPPSPTRSSPASARRRRSR